MFELLNTINIATSHYLSENRHRWIFALISGLFLSCSLPAISEHYPYVALTAWFALVPLLILIKSSSSYMRLSLEAFLMLFTYHLVAFSWLLGLHPLSWQGFTYFQSLLISALAWILPSIFHSSLLLIFVCFARALYLSKANLASKDSSLRISDMFVLALLWATIQHKLGFSLGLLSIFFVPVHLLAYSQHHFLELIQIASIVGAIGLEFLIVLLNVYLSNFFNIKQINVRKQASLSNYNLYQPSFSIHNLREQSVMTLVLFFVLFGSLYYGHLRLQTQFPRDLSFVIAQSRLSAEASRGAKLNAANIIQTMMQSSFQLYQYTDVVPTQPPAEASSLMLDSASPSIQPPAETSSLIAVAKPQHTDFIFWPEGSAPLLLTNFVPDLFQGLFAYSDIFIFGTYHSARGRLYNSVAFAEPTSPTLQFYNKIQLVPFGEYSPAASLLPASLRELASFAIGSGFDRGDPEQRPIQTSKARIGTSLCFELLFADLVRKQAERSEFLLNLNDLSWFDSRSIERAFLAIAKFRAIENSQALILASNYGCSTGIDACGRLSPRYIHKTQERSIYNLYGW